MPISPKRSLIFLCALIFCVHFFLCILSSTPSRDLTLSFCSLVLLREQEDLGGDDDGGGASTVPQTGYLELKDSAGHAEMAVVSAEEVGNSTNIGRGV